MMELGQLSTGHRPARIAGQGFRTIRIERGSTLEERQGLGPLIAGLILQPELDERLGILRVLRSCLGEGRNGIDPSHDRPNLFQELFRRRLVAGDPVDLLSVPVEEEEKGGAADAEPFDQTLARDIASAGPIKDEVLLEELGELGDIVELLDQQLTVASAVFLEEVEEQQLPARLGPGQRILERAR
jgi:hypothetical protein